MLQIGVILAGAYLLWRMFSVTSGVVTSATGSVAGAAVSLWNTLTSWPGDTMPLLGNVVLPSGQQVPLSSLNIRTDNAGHVFINLSGATYQLQPSDASGNWPAVAVS